MPYYSTKRFSVKGNLPFINNFIEMKQVEIAKCNTYVLCLYPFQHKKTSLKKEDKSHRYIVFL